MQSSAFFILDSTLPASLTLRDYSKVVAGHKLSFCEKFLEDFQEKLSKKTASAEDARRLHAVNATPLDHDMSANGLPCRSVLCRNSNAALRARHRRTHPGPRRRSL